MKKQKMSLEKMKTVLSHVLSREDMKQVMAGSGQPWCGICHDFDSGNNYACYSGAGGGCFCGFSGWSC